MSIVKRGKAVNRRDANRRVQQRQQPARVPTVVPDNETAAAVSAFNS